MRARELSRPFPLFDDTEVSLVFELSGERGDSLFLDFHSTEQAASSWIPFLPKPGTYAHAKYGDINVTPEQNAELVASVKNRVYQEHIPLDAEHETKLSGAVAWIRDMRVNEDGSADAYVDWTSRGASLLGSGQFRYISPEWFRAWRDPATGEVHKNVVAGGALTTRPFFKDKALRALVASENGVDVIGNDEELQFAMKECKNCGAQFEGDGDVCQNCAAKQAKEEPPVPDNTYTAAEVDERIESIRQEFTDQLTAAQDETAKEKEARIAAETRLAALEKERRSARFTDLVLDYEGGARWFGDAEKHVSMLEVLAENFGEDSEPFKTYVETQQTIASTLRESELFKELGTSQGSARDGAENKLDAMAKERQKANPSLTYAQAYTEVLSTDEGKQLYAQL